MKSILLRYFGISLLGWGGLLILTFCSITLYARNAARQFNTGISPSELISLYMGPVIVAFGAGIVLLLLIFALWRLFLYLTGEPEAVTRQRKQLMCWSMFGLPLLAAFLAVTVVITNFPEPYLPTFFLSTPS